MSAAPFTVLWTARSRNRKTGDVPTAWVGASQAEARESCSGCPLLDDGRCYSWSGATQLAAGSARKNAERQPHRYTMAAALAARVASARMVRVTGLGDIGRSGRALADSIVAEAARVGLAVVGYTHHWREAGVAAAWRGRLMASTERLEDADRAVREGWRASVVVPADYPRLSKTPEGRAVVVCPEQATGRVTCNECRLCDAAKPGPVIAFREHGNGSARVAKRAPATVEPPAFGEVAVDHLDGPEGCRCDYCAGYHAPA